MRSSENICYNETKKLVKKVMENLDISTVNFSTLASALRSEGYSVLFYSAATPTDATGRLLETLELSDFIQTRNSFSYADGTVRLVFIRKDVSDREKVYLMALELGRILTTKIHYNCLVQGTPEEEAKAEAFAYHLVDVTNHGFVHSFFKFYPVRSKLVAVLSVLFVNFVVFVIGFKIMSNGMEPCQEKLFKPENAVQVGAIVPESVPITGQDLPKEPSQEVQVFAVQPNKQPEVAASEQVTASDAEQNTSAGFVLSEQERVYYATKDGKKYHLTGCSYIRGKETITLTSDTIASGGYTPCSRCFSSSSGG